MTLFLLKFKTNGWIYFYIVGTSDVVFSWYKNDSLLFEGGANVNNYTSSQVKLSDAGNYTCVVKNDFGSIQHKFNVDVYGKDDYNY